MATKKTTKVKTTSTTNATNSETTATLATAATGSEKEYELFSPIAQQIAQDAVIQCRADVHVAQRNALAGFAAISPFQARILKELPEISYSDLSAIPNIALAVIFAAAQVDPKAGAVTTVKANLAQARALRKVMLSSARSLADANVIPAREVEVIEEGKGDLDVAQDCVDLAALFRKYATAVEGKTAITAQQLTDAANIGSTLLVQLKPSKSKATTGPTAAAKAQRLALNQMWTVFTQRWNDMWRVGAYLFGRDQVDSQVPPLKANMTRAKKPTTTANPTATTATTTANPTATTATTTTTATATKS